MASHSTVESPVENIHEWLQGGIPTKVFVLVKMENNYMPFNKAMIS